MLALVIALVALTSRGMAQQALVMPLSCPLVAARGIASATAGQLDAADSLLGQAGARCPKESVVHRELAAVRFKQGRYGEAATLAKRYLDAVPRDTLAWQLLATSRYLAGNRTGALQAWNRIGLPLVDSLHLDSDGRTRPLLARVVTWSPGAPLTSNAFVLADRRMADLPTIERSALSYQMTPQGTVHVRASAVERPLLDPVWRLAATTLVRAIAAETIQLEVANPLAADETWNAEWRWETARPRRALGLALPLRAGVPGVLTVDAVWQRVRVAVDPGSAAALEDTWLQGSMGFSTWLSPVLRPSVALGLEAREDGSRYVTTSAGIEVRSLDDRLRVSGVVARATGLRPHGAYHTLAGRVLWNSGAHGVGTTWSARAGGEWASGSAPVGAWPFLSSSLSRGVTLRAEPSIEDDALSGRATGRRILHGGVAADQYLARLGPVDVSAGVFLDGARVNAPPALTNGPRNYLDGGIGMLMGIAGGAMGFLRVDAAWGLLAADRRHGVTVGYHTEWPVWSRDPR